MGASDSKPGKTEPLMLCKERKRFIEQAIDSRYAFAAAHVSYIQSLRNVGVALRRFTEAEVQKESSSLNPTSTTEVDKTPSHSSYPSPSPSPSNFTAADSPLSPTVSRLSYMKSSVENSVSVSIEPCRNGYLNDSESLSFSMPPPPPPLPEPGSSWDYFDPSDDLESFSFMRNEEWDVDLDNVGNVDSEMEKVMNKSLVPLVVKPELEKKEVEEREDANEFITHRAKDFLSSIRDIDHKFFRASEAGREVSRMLEANKIRVGYSVVDGRKPLGIDAAFDRLCCLRRKPALVSHESSKPGMKVITWKRTTSSRSSSSRNPLKEDNDDSGSDFMEDFGMIAGSHSSTLERMYAWERKLYDEVKAIDSIRKEYNRKCDKLRHQFAKDLKSQVIDKTRAIVKNLHSRTTVALFTVDSISKRIEKMRDEELLPQLLELIHGMWKSMLECHHSQYITISLAYHGKSSKANNPQIMMVLEEEIECFGVSFANWINCHTSYIEALNSWLQHCILKPPEQTKGRRMAFSPRRLVAPPIFILCLDWLAGIKSLPSNNVSKAVEDFLYQLRLEMEKRAVRCDSVEKEENAVDGLSGDLRCIHTSLAKVFDGLHKFSEASLKMYEDVRKKSEAARNIYSNYRQPVVRF